MIQILGDGNCFYRSLVRSILDKCPAELQEELSMVMRKFLNPKVLFTNFTANVQEQEKDLQFSAFQVEGESDSKTMRNAGKWADHVQNLKASAYLDRPIFLIRFDDIGVKYVVCETLNCHLFIYLGYRRSTTTCTWTGLCNSLFPRRQLFEQ